MTNKSVSDIHLQWTHLKKKIAGPPWETPCWSRLLPRWLCFAWNCDGDDPNLRWDCAFRTSRLQTDNIFSGKNNRGREVNMLDIKTSGGGKSNDLEIKKKIYIKTKQNQQAYLLRFRHHWHPRKRLERRGAACSYWRHLERRARRWWGLSSQNSDSNIKKENGKRNKKK